MPQWNGYGGGSSFGDDQGFGSYGGTLGGFSGGFDSGAAAAAGAGLSAGYGGGWSSGYGGMAGSPAGRGVGSSRSSSSSVGAGLSSGGYGGYSGGTSAGYSGGGYSGGMAGSPAGQGVGSSPGYGGGLSGGMGGFGGPSGGSNSDHGFGGMGGMAGSPAGRGVGGGGLGGGSNSDHSFGGSIGGMMGSPAGQGVGGVGGFGGLGGGGGMMGTMGQRSNNAATGNAHYGSFNGANPPNYGPDFNRADQVYHDALSNGYSDSLARGILGSLQGENSTLNPQAVNRSTKAYGIAQDLGARKRGLMSEYGPVPSLQNELDYNQQEMLGIAPYNADPGVNRFSAWVDANPNASVNAATKAHMTMFENPGNPDKDPSLARSLRNRQAFAANYGNPSSVIAGNEGTSTLASAGEVNKPYESPAPIDMTRANPIPSPIGFHGYPSQARSRSPYVDSARAIAQAMTGTPVSQSGDPMAAAPSAPAYSSGRVPGTIMQSPVDSSPFNAGQVPSGIMQGQSPAPTGYRYSPDSPVSVGSIHSPVMQGQSPAGATMQPTPFDAPTLSPLQGGSMAAKSQGPGPGWVDMGTRHTDTFGVYENTPMTAREKLAAALSGKSDHMFINRGAKRNKLPMKKAKPK